MCQIDENEILRFSNNILQFWMVILTIALFKFFLRIKLNLVFGTSIIIFSILFFFVNLLVENPHPFIKHQKN